MRSVGFAATREAYPPISERARVGGERKSPAFAGLFQQGRNTDQNTIF